MGRAAARKVVLVLTTVAKESDALKMSRSLVRKRMAACANVVPGIRSLYWWEGKIVRDHEVLVIFKTTSRRYKALENEVQAIHPYRVPEILAIPVGKGYAPYLAWVFKEVTD